MVNYNNGKIYKILSHLGDKVYIGSTTKEYLSQRMSTHRKNYNTRKQGKRGLVTSFLVFDEYGIDNCAIMLLEACPCESKDLLHAREAHYIKTIKCVNKMIPQRTRKEYYTDNKDAIRVKQKAYDIERREAKKEYKEVNKERIKARDKVYYIKNKELILKKKQESYAAKKLQQQSQQ